MPEKQLQYIEMNPDADPTFTVIWLHGLGADGHDFEALVPELKLPDSLPIRYVFPHAPTRPITINMGMVMRGWYDILEMDVAESVDVQGIDESVNLLRDLIQYEIDSGMPSERIILAGFSQGGAIVLHAGLRFEKPLAGILALSTYLPTLSALADSRSPQNENIPILMAHGQYDPLIPITTAVKTRDELLHLNYDLQWHEYPMQHEVCIKEIGDVRAWMLKVTA